ncbi:hypothetical protein M885DRAFT_287985 [Pelagophyceae sp. CCMP2097]|nr:hypothetical protein M885DRAFT_287985 [Pelagophyceae sp. CCMP2097]
MGHKAVLSACLRDRRAPPSPGPASLALERDPSWGPSSGPSNGTYPAIQGPPSETARGAVPGTSLGPRTGHGADFQREQGPRRETVLGDRLKVKKSKRPSGPYFGAVQGGSLRRKRFFPSTGPSTGHSLGPKVPDVRGRFSDCGRRRVILRTVGLWAVSDTVGPPLRPSDLMSRAQRGRPLSDSVKRTCGTASGHSGGLVRPRRAMGASTDRLATLIKWPPQMTSSLWKRLRGPTQGPVFKTASRNRLRSLEEPSQSALLQGRPSGPSPRTRSRGTLLKGPFSKDPSPKDPSRGIAFRTVLWDRLERPLETGPFDGPYPGPQGSRVEGRLARFAVSIRRFDSPFRFASIRRFDSPFRFAVSIRRFDSP